MSAFALFFLWLAALARGGLTVREAGLYIVGAVVEEIEAADSMSPRDLMRLHGWLGWAEWAARRADPRAGVHLKGRGDGSPEALIARIVAVSRVLMAAPKNPPRRRARYGAKHRRRVAYAVAPLRALTAPRAGFCDTS